MNLYCIINDNNNAVKLLIFFMCLFIKGLNDVKERLKIILLFFFLYFKFFNF